MSKMSRQSRLLMVTLVFSSLLQMPFMALNPVIDYIQKNVFTDKSLAQVQTAISALNLFVMLFALLGALIVAKGLLSKKAVVVTGLVLFGLTGLAAILFHSRYWNLWLLSVLIGSGSGFFISTLTSILFDNFNEQELRLATGLQAATVNVGGIVFGALGGVLALSVWYGGYLLELVGLPVAVLAALTIPSQREKDCHADLKKTKKARLPLDVYYFAFATFIFFMLYMSCGLNISTHLSNAGFTSPATAGLASAVQMVGGVAAGLVFSRLSSKIGEAILPLAFAVLFAGFTILNLGRSALILNLLGVFVAGLSLSMLFPYCIFSASKYVDETNSATAASLVQAMAPGIGGFISPLVLTTLTSAFYPDKAQMNLRYQLLGFIALALGALFYIGNRLRAKRACAGAEKAQ